MRDSLKKAIRAHAAGHIQKHVANVEVLLERTQGIAEHPDVIDTIEKELDIIATYHDQIEVLDKYFP